MRHFFDRWYGDGCPFWTWPATIGGLTVVGVVAILVNGLFAQSACESRGGNLVKPDGCYLVTTQKID